MNLAEEPGWRGSFTRDHADGALPNGTRIVKSMDEEGDGHKQGDLGTVLGSINVADVRPETYNGPPVTFFYFIEWDDMPKCAVATVDVKIRAAA